MLYSQTKLGARVVLLPGWGYHIGQNFYRNGTTHLPGIIVDRTRGASWVYVKLDDGRTIASDARAFKPMEQEES